MQIQPLHSLVLVQRHKKDTHTAGGLLLPETSIEESLWVDVIACGPKVTKVKPGQVAFARQWVGFKLEEEKGFMSPLLVPEELLEAVQEN